MELLIRVPEGIKVQKQKGLSGLQSSAVKKPQGYLTKPESVKEGYWYGPASPSDEWVELPDQPDPDETAKFTR